MLRTVAAFVAIPIRIKEVSDFTIHCQQRALYLFFEDQCCRKNDFFG